MYRRRKKVPCSVLSVFRSILTKAIETFSKILKSDTEIHSDGIVWSGHLCPYQSATFPKLPPKSRDAVENPRALNTRLMVEIVIL